MSEPAITVRVAVDFTKVTEALKKIADAVEALLAVAESLYVTQEPGT